MVHIKGSVRTVTGDILDIWIFHEDVHPVKTHVLLVKVVEEFILLSITELQAINICNQIEPVPESCRPVPFLHQQDLGVCHLVKGVLYDPQSLPLTLAHGRFKTMILQSLFPELNMHILSSRCDLIGDVHIPLGNTRRRNSNFSHIELQLLYNLRFWGY